MSVGRSPSPFCRFLQGWQQPVVVCLHPALHVLFRCIHKSPLCSSSRPPVSNCLVRPFDWNTILSRAWSCHGLSDQKQSKLATFSINTFGNRYCTQSCVSCREHHYEQCSKVQYDSGWLFGPALSCQLVQGVTPPSPLRHLPLFPNQGVCILQRAHLYVTVSHEALSQFTQIWRTLKMCTLNEPIWRVHHDYVQRASRGIPE